MNVPMCKSTPLDDLRNFKLMTQEVAGHFLADDNRQIDGYRLMECAKYVRIYQTANNDMSIDALYCKHPHCPLCQRQKARKYCSKVHRLLDLNSHLLHSNWVYLTLTVRDCNVDDLRYTADSMTKAFQRLSSHKFWKENVLGGVRFFEVTESPVDSESVHPHFHCLLLVRPSMFAGNNYVSTSKWARKWQQALQIYYEPMVHIKRLRGRPDEMRRHIVGHAGYSMKHREKILDRRRFLAMTDEMRNLNRVQSFGAICGLFSELNDQVAFDAFKQLKEIRAFQEPSQQVWDEYTGKYRSD